MTTREPVNTTVIAADEFDFGAGKDRRIEFVNCQWTVDDRGCLHVYSRTMGSVAAFADGAWLAATNGSINGADSVTVAAVKR